MTEGRFVSEFCGNLREEYPGLVVHQHWTLPAGGHHQTPNPYDFYLLWEGRMAAFEAKQIKGPSLQLDRYRPHQTEELRKVRKAGHPAYYIVNVRELSEEKAPSRFRVFTRGGKVNCCVLLSPDDMDGVVARALAGGRKSITPGMVDEASSLQRGLVFGRLRGAWDVRSFIDWVFT